MHINVPEYAKGSTWTASCYETVRTPSEDSDNTPRVLSPYSPNKTFHDACNDDNVCIPYNHNSPPKKRARKSFDVFNSDVESGSEPEEQ